MSQRRYAVTVVAAFFGLVLRKGDRCGGMLFALDMATPFMQPMADRLADG